MSVEHETHPSESVRFVSSGWQLCAESLPGGVEQRGKPRKTRFEAVKKLYGLRSKAVHGEPLSQDQLVSAMNESNRLLRQLLLLMIEKGHVLGADDFDDALLG